MAVYTHSKFNSILIRENKATSYAIGIGICRLHVEYGGLAQLRQLHALISRGKQEKTTCYLEDKLDRPLCSQTMIKDMKV